MPTEKELMLKQADAETTYQKKLTAGTNITIDPVTNVISSAGGGSTVQYTDNTSNGESVGILAINGQSHPIHIPRLAEGTGITINKDITTNVYTISLSGGGGGTTKTYMGETNPDELVGEDGDLYFKYHKIETDIPTELTLPSLPDDATVPFPITNFNSYDSFTFYYTDGNNEPHNRKVNTGDLVISDSPADESPNSNIYTWNSYRYVQATRSTNGEGLVLRVCGNCLYKLEANVTEVDLGIDKSYAKVEDTWLPSGDQVEANPEETSETPLTKIKIDGVTYYIAAGGSAEIVPLTKAEWDALPASKYTDNILYLITDSFTTETTITPNPEGEATDTLTKLQIDETIYSLAGGSGAAAIEKTQAEYNALTPAQKTNGAIYMVQGEVGEEKDLTERMSDYTSSSGTVSAYNSKSANFLAWHALASEDSFDARVNGEYWAGIGDGAYLQFDFIKPVMILKIGFASYLASNFKIMYSTDGNEYIYAQNVTREAQSGYVCTKTDTTLDSPIRDCVSIRLVCDGAEYNVGALHFYGYDSVESVNKIYYMDTEYANTNGDSGGGNASFEATVLYDTPITVNGTYTLADSYENYDFISIKAGNGTNEADVHTYAVDDLKRAMSDSKVITNPNTGGWFNFTISANELTIPNKTVHTIYGVIGYKIVGGGGEGGSGEGYTETLLYQPQTAFTTGVITLSDDISNYDALIFRTKFSDGTRAESIVSSSEIEKIGYIANPSISNEHVLIKAYSGNYFRVVRGSETDDKVLNFFHASGDESIYEIYGISYASGGGSSIIPNPQEEPTDTLNSVKIDGTVYNIESSSEGEGVEIYSEDEYIVGSLNINGTKKKIYQKTFVLNNITVTQSSGYSYNITSLGIEDVVESPRGFVKITNSDRRSIPFNLLSGYGFTATVKPNQILLERAGNDITISQAVVTIRYTKTVETDAPAWGGSVNNYYANFIDTNNVIQAETQVSSGTTGTYTATEDCYIRVKLWRSNTGSSSLSIDGVEVLTNYSDSGTTALYNTIPLKKEQIATINAGAGSPCSYTVYGISYGSGGGSSSESSVHYSTTEQVIGTWIDGKPLYQKTYENLNIGTVQNYTLTLSDLQDIEYFRVVPEGSQISATVPFPYIHYGTENLVGYFTDVTNGVPSLEIRKGSTASQSNLQFLTIQYTKTTD